MQSFRTELENPIVEKDIIDLAKKIEAFKKGEIPEERFRSLRLARGVYGQRQSGVQMVRIKLPFGKVSFKQLLRIADVSDEYASSNLHFTTRQDIQIHFVSLDRTPELWAELEQDQITLREACGNTVRNVTASDIAGIDVNEPFDVSPYAHAFFTYFLRNPVCQEMGRKIKFAFSSSDADTAFAFIHDLGFVPKIKIENGIKIRGFRVMFGGGLGAQPQMAYPVFEFLPANQIIPFAEATLRVFDRYGERNNRNKARMKFLVQKLGLEEVLQLIEIERKALSQQTFEIDITTVPFPQIPTFEGVAVKPVDQIAYDFWKATNVIPQKQEGYYAVYVKVTTGDMSTALARKFVAAIKPYVADEIRITIGQNLLLKFVSEQALPALFNALFELGLTKSGANTLFDVTTCPGTDTCNLGISNSTELARVLEKDIAEHYATYLKSRNITIKISGCMNSCGQHGLANIGFHGSSLKAGGKVLPAVQVLLGGGSLGNGDGRAADKVVKVPSKRATQVLELVLNDFEQYQEGENFIEYYLQKGKDYFYQMLKPLADLTQLTDAEFIDWGHEETFSTAIGVGECAGVVIDLVATLIFEAEEKLEWAQLAFAENKYADAIYHAYAAMISAGKALLLDKGINTNTQKRIIDELDAAYVGEFDFNFQEKILQINQNEPNRVFAARYLEEAQHIVNILKAVRNQTLAANS